MSITGRIKVIDENAVQDGPGVRSLIFLKGCHLRCKWCQNPELIRPEAEVWIVKFLCQTKRVPCKEQCKEACPTDAIKLDSEGVIEGIDRTKCIGAECAKCVTACPAGALQVVGYDITAEELHKGIAKFLPFYERSANGGVTLTGGEPLHQPEFASEVLKLCQEDGIHTAIESCLFAPYEDLWKVASHCNLILCDVKHMDDNKHKEGTGVSNKLILENFRRLNRDFKNDIVVRIPLIPGFNDDEDNVARTAEFLCPLEQVKGIDLLPFNPLPVAKYEALSTDWIFSGVKIQDEEYLNKLRGIVDKSCKRLRCTISGLW